MPLKQNNGWYEAFKAKDVRFDGRFFIGVASTKIYCRPICKAKLPKQENCTYYLSAAEAEKAGYRPCLLCRPELAPNLVNYEDEHSIALKAARLLEESASNSQAVAKVAEKINYSSRHLHRLFTNELKVSPHQYLQTYRLLLAKGLLTDTKLNITDIALAAGFGSIRSFNEAFKKHYRLSPSTLRKEVSHGDLVSDYLKVYLGYQQPFHWQDILSFLELRAIPQVEKVSDGKYYRTLSIQVANITYRGYLSVENCASKNQLLVKISTSLLPVLAQVINRVKDVFDLKVQPNIIYEKIKIINDYHSGIVKEGTRIPGSFDPFEMIVRAILGQQISIKAARTLTARLVENFGTPLDTKIEGLNYTFFSFKDIIALEDNIEEQFGVLGIISRRSQTILALAKVFERQEINFKYPLNPEEEIKKLQAIPGIGIWTAHYIALRTMSYTDAFLHTDLGIIKALSPLKPKEILELAEEWRPWRGYAMINLWNSLATKEEK